MPDREAVKAGLEQIPSPELKRLISHIEKRRPLLLNGYIYEDGKG